MIIQRYLYREILQGFAAVLSILLLIYVSNRFVRYLGEAASGSIASEAVLKLLALKLVGSLVLLLPLALFIAVMLGFGRMYRDSEIVALAASGVGIHRLGQSVLWLSLGFAAVAMVLSLYVSPRAAGMVQDVRAQAKEESEISGVYPGRFKEFGDGDQVVYVQDISSDRKQMENVFVQVRRGGRLNLLVAKSGYQTVDEVKGERFIVLVDGRRYEGSPGHADYIVTSFQKHAVRIEAPRRGAAYRELEALPSIALLRSNDPAHVAELQWRLSFPVSLVVLGMLAVPLSRTSPRQGKFGKLFVAVLIYFVYNNSIGIAQQLVERGELPPGIGVWSVHAVVGFVAALLLWAQISGRWRPAALWKRLRVKG